MSEHAGAGDPGLEGSAPPLPEGTKPADAPVGTAPGEPAPASADSGAERTRTSAAYSGLVAGVLILVLLLIFILENTRSIEIHYLGITGHLSLGVALLFAAVAGAVLTAILGTARIVQLRLHARRTRR